LSAQQDITLKKTHAYNARPNAFRVPQTLNVKDAYPLHLNLRINALNPAHLAITVKISNATNAYLPAILVSQNQYA
jgi:hypothetical protein